MWNMSQIHKNIKFNFWDCNYSIKQEKKVVFFYVHFKHPPLFIWTQVPQGPTQCMCPTADSTKIREYLWVAAPIEHNSDWWNAVIETIVAVEGEAATPVPPIYIYIKSHLIPRDLLPIWERIKGTRQWCCRISLLLSLIEKYQYILPAYCGNKYLYIFLVNKIDLLVLKT